MTPAAQFAQKREEAIALIRQHAPSRLQDPLIELLRPAIALSATRTEDSEIPLGASKFGGAPDVPPGFEWPMWNEKPLGFLAQINLEEVAPFDVEELLPKSGLLSFFVISREDTPIWGDPDQRDGWRVFFWPKNGLQPFQPPTDSHEFETHTFSVKIEAKWTLVENEEWPKVGDTREESNEFLWTWEKFDTYEQILGSARPLQESPSVNAEESARGLFPGDKKLTEDQADIRRCAKDWQLLLQLETDFLFHDECFDLGTLYFLIRRNAMAVQDFSNAWMIGQTT